MLRPTRLTCLECDVVLIPIKNIVAVAYRNDARPCSNLLVQESCVELIDSVKFRRNVECVWICLSVVSETLVLLIVVLSMKCQTIIRACVSSIDDERSIATRQVVAQFELVVKVDTVEWHVCVPTFILLLLQAWEDWRCLKIPPVCLGLLVQECVTISEF